MNSRWQVFIAYKVTDHKVFDRIILSRMRCVGKVGFVNREKGSSVNSNVYGG